ncbi:TonB-dependent receptor plug domain-containing protein [Actinobacillus equuli]|uniref:TonB-dependent receptor plug domain-containing protein n=2 Tax=Actinobacillus equuli TaxID=718 RepID=UPI002441EDB6|nr:TonB-dependent receptor plug domain-containing protein [Actinobacillus equuli]WGE75582.1 TonB-dependent receptor plug domain-containing protein [Actinobacillus equuli subsp. haemolyticus]
MMKRFSHSLLYSSILPALTNAAYAEETAELEEVVVVGQSFSQQVGTQKITAEQIKRQAAKNGGITDLLKSNPNVRFSNEADLSTNAGEIRPNEVSFHGEKYYNNNFILDGMSNNDNMNPIGNQMRNGEAVGANPYDLPNGSSQSMWIDSSLLESLEVFDSNVSAKYGNFTGGVIDAKLKDPNFERRTGKIYYRTTRDDWTHFYIQEGQEDAFEKARRLDYQPRFVKHQFGVNASEKLSDNLAILFSYDRLQSTMKNAHPDMRYLASPNTPIEKKQSRINENYILRAVYLPENGDLWRATVMYSPNYAKQFKSDTENGAFENIGGGVQANLEWEKTLDWAKVKSYIGYKKTGNRTEYDVNDYHRYMSSDNFYWTSGTYSQYGGYGKRSLEKEIYTLKQDYEGNAFDFAGMEHKLSFGWIAEIAKAKSGRDTSYHAYYYRKAPNVVCNDAEACLEGDQFAYQRLNYNQHTVKVRDDDFALYLQDQLKWKRLELSLGSRLSYNRFLDNTNIDYRLSGSYDLFDDQSTIIFAGANRYYKGSLLSSRLRQGLDVIGKDVREFNADGTIGEWTPEGRGVAPNRYLQPRKLKTPYSDEKVLGLSQRVWDTRRTFKWVNRQSKNQFASANRYFSGEMYRVMNNNGRSENDTFTLSVAPVKGYEWQYAKLNWDLGLRISRSKSSNKTYNNDVSLKTKAIYNGKLIDADDLPPNDFNTPWSAFLNVNTEFPTLNLNWNQRFSFTKGRKTREVDTTVLCNGQYSDGERSLICGNYVGNADIYEDLEMGNEFNLDWRFIYKQPLTQTQFLEFTLDVNNVLNRKSLSKSSKKSSVYKQGRNFWVGVSYNW